MFGQESKAVVPKVMIIGECEVQYLTFTQPINAHKTPVILLGGAFHSMGSMMKDAQILAKENPVYLVSLPGLGSSKQYVAGMNEEDYSLILRTFFDNLGIDSASLIAQSYSTSIALTFGSLYEERVKKIILCGVTKELRESVRHLLEESLHYLVKNEMDRFASGLALNVMNFSQRRNVACAQSVNRSLFHHLRTFEEEDKARYKATFLRMIEQKLDRRAPQCPVLVISGEFDNFTTPYENFQIARNCPNGEYIVIKGADHLGTHEKADVYQRVFKRFLADLPLNRMKDVDVFPKNEFPREKIRMEPRWLLNDVGFLDNGNGVFVPVNIVDINNFGCRLFTSFSDHRSLRRDKKFILHIPSEDMQVDVILFKQTESGHFRGIFKHNTFEVTQKFEVFINKVSDTCSSAYAA
ncbi:MAG: alpha/beta hydrolase [Bdellovibrionota bacterium]|jgi:pimeloyl-ACP methyl ester carboxylesterase|nr:alpha/beta hydrolase [Bdellovibrionota bacterium]